jgi:transcription initiation factor IIE alpha subunit
MTKVKIKIGNCSKCGKVIEFINYRRMCKQCERNMRKISNERIRDKRIKEDMCIWQSDLIYC